MIVLTTMHDQNYQTLANETWETNKVEYATKHGYSYLAKTEDFYGFEPGFEKIQFLIDTLEAYPDIEWIWWTGTDSLITNFDIKVEDKINEALEYAKNLAPIRSLEAHSAPIVNVVKTPHIIMSADFNFKINCDSMLVKNSPEALGWLKDIMQQMPKYASHQYKEQQCMLDNLNTYESIVLLMPQSFMNSYEYRMYTVAPWNYKQTTDVNGDRGQWESGDWFIHWPGTQPAERMSLVKEFKEKIINT